VVNIFASRHKDVTGGIRYGVLVFHEDNEGIALLGLQRLPDILRHLRESLASSNMTEREMMMARYIALNLGHTPGNEDVGRLLADYALKYENVDLWLDAFKIEQRRLTHDNMNNFLKATQLFGFHQVEERSESSLDINSFPSSESSSVIVYRIHSTLLTIYQTSRSTCSANCMTTPVKTI
jgi:hypothetical protein